MPIIYSIRTDKKLQMIKDSDINSFIESLSSHLVVLIHRVSEKEKWSTDDHDDVRTLINTLSELLDKADETRLIKASHLLMYNSAYFTLPRFLRFFAVMSEKNPKIVEEILNPLNTQLIPDGAIFLSTVINRLRYVVQSILIKEIFDPETIESIYQSVLQHEKDSKQLHDYPAKAEVSLKGAEQRTANSNVENSNTSNTEEEDIDLDDDAPYEAESKQSKEDNPISESHENVVSKASDDGATILREKIKNKKIAASVAKDKNTGEAIKVETVLSIIEEMTGQSFKKDDEDE
jgi:hypothetical protein